MGGVELAAIDGINGQAQYLVGKSALKTALAKADKGFLGARRAVTKLAPRRGSAPTESPAEDFTQQTSLLDTEPAEAAFPLPEPLLAQP